VGSDDGLVHVTRDRGGSWQEVTPDGVGEAQINSIEVSPHDPGTAWVVATAYKFNDFTPHVFRTDDYGESWSRTVEGIADDDWVRVVREDPVRPGLLYAGTETGLYLSADGGERWHPFQLDLPVVPITDLAVKDDDLVAATQGRAFWVLDDLGPLRQWTEEVAEADMHLFEPAPAVQASFFGGGGGRTGENPPAGAQIFYRFDEAPEGLVTLEILDEAGEPVRTWATDPEEAGDEAFSRLPAPEAGLNRAAWDFRTEGLPRVEGLVPFGSLQGRRMPPGTYRVRLTHGEESLTRTLEVLPDPRRDATMAQYAEQDRFVAEAQAMARDLYASVMALRSVRDQVDAIVESAEETEYADTVRAVGEALGERITGWEEEVVQPRQRTFQDVINYLNRLDAQILALVGSVEGTEPPVTAGARERLGDLGELWSARAGERDVILDEELARFEAFLEELGIPHVVVRPPGDERPVTQEDGDDGEARLR
jgi:hypothetical protein